jgi:hypothetical protein
LEKEPYTMLFAVFGVGQVLWSIFWFFLFFVWIMLLFRVFGDIFASPDLSGVSKVIWMIAVIVVPYLGVFAYVIARGDKMNQHQLDRMQAQQAAMDDYIRSVAQSQPPQA